jgi:ferredoxin-NADP reductase
MAGTALRRRLTTPWVGATLVGTKDETATARTLRFDVRDWPGHLPGQHADLRLTADDGYTATRSYSIASAPDGGAVELTVQAVPDGEVSPFLVNDLAVGDSVELRGPLGGWFVWRTTQTEPVLLVAGGAGIVPLMAMVRTRQRAETTAPFRLIYSVRTPADVIYADELTAGAGAEVAFVYTRSSPTGTPHRLMDDDLMAHGWPADRMPTCYVCGPTGFVEAAAMHLLAAGHRAHRIRTERFG